MRFQLSSIAHDRRASLRLVAAAALCGFGLVAAGATLVRAADDAGVFEVIHADYLARLARRVAPAPRLSQAPTARREAPTRHAVASFASLPGPMSRPAARAAAWDGAPSRLAGRETLCVRTCDGYAFPLGPLRATSDVPVHEAACQAACPGAETRLYGKPAGALRDDLDRARSIADGTSYRALPTAGLFRSRVVAACSCTGAGAIAARWPIERDATLRTGDVVVDAAGRAKAFERTGPMPYPKRAFSDFRRSPVLSPAARRQVDAVTGTSQREAAARAFSREVRVRQAGLTVFTPPGGTAANVSAFQVVSLDSGGIRVVSPAFAAIR